MGDGRLVSAITFSMPAEAPDEALREGQREMEEELRTLKRILERENVRQGEGARPPPSPQRASTRNSGDWSSRPRMTSVAFPRAA